MKKYNKVTDLQLYLIERYMNCSLIGQVGHYEINDKSTEIMPNKEYDFMFSDAPGHISSWRNKDDDPEKLYDPELTYKLNNYTYRSDDFNVHQQQKDIVYSGCSFTFGVGVPYKSIWAYMLNESLNQNNFYNLGISGGSYESIIFDIYTYIKKFGKPKAFIVLFPPPVRLMFMQESKNIKIVPFRVVHMKDEDEKRFFRENKDLLNYDLWIIKFYHMVTALELYLESIGVEFLWGCWDLYVNKIFSKTTGLKNFINIDGNEADSIKAAIMRNEIDYSNYVNKYWINARDTHPSVLQHFTYYKIFEAAWKDKINSKNINDWNGEVQSVRNWSGEVSEPRDSE